MRDYDSRYSDDYDERPSSRAPRRSPYSDDDYEAPASRRASSASRYSNPYDDRAPSSGTSGSGYVGGRSRGSTYSNPYADDTYSGGRSSRVASGTGAYNTSSLNNNSRSSYNTGAYDTGYTSRTSSGSAYGASSRTSQTGAYSNPYATSSRSGAGHSSHTGTYDTGAINRTAAGSALQRSSQASSPSSQSAYNTGTYNTGYTNSGSRSLRGASYGSSYDNYDSTRSRSSRSSAYDSGYGNYGSTAIRSSHGSASASGDDYSSTASRSSRSTYGNGYDDYGGTASRSSRRSTYGSAYDDDDGYDDRSSRRSFSGKSEVQKKNKVLNIWLACLSGLLVISIALAFLLPEMIRAEAPPPASSAPEDAYDVNANPLPSDELGDTVLPASEDGGAEYLANSLLIGDDNIERMLDYAALSEMLTLDNCIGVGGMSIQAVPSFGCVQFEGESSLSTIPEAVTLMQPLRILLAFGSSDASSAADVSGFISSYRIAIESVRAAYSYADIIVCAIPPIAQNGNSNSAKMTAIDAYNAELARLAQELELKFLNVSETLKDPATGYCQSSYTVEDSLHLNEAGLTAMVNYARSHTNITEDARPKPLNDIPKRVSTEDSSGAASSIASSLAASSAAASSTSRTDGVKVVFSTLEHVQQSPTIGGKIQVAGQTTNSYTVYLQPGATCPTAVAVPASGYRFVYWACSVGRIANRENTTLANFVVSPTLKKGDTLYITAIFEGIPASTTPSASSSVSPTNYNIAVSLAEGAPTGAGASASPTAIAVGGTTTLTATPVQGYTVIFAVSSGNATITTVSPTTASLTLNGAGDTSVVATYVPSPSTS